MELTAFGTALLPIIALTLHRPVRQLQSIFFLHIFGAAAIANIGGFGIVPELLPALVFLAYVLLQFLLGVRYPGDLQALRTLMPLFIVGVYALATAFVVPQLFAGEALVHPQKNDFGAIPLAFGPGNLTQSSYLATNLIFVATASCFLTRSGIDFNRILRAYLLSGIVAFGFVCWSLANRLTGIWFPTEFLLSNAGYAVLDTQAFGSVPRISGTFTEPAALGAAMTEYLFVCVWMLVRGHRNRIATWLLPCALLGVFFSTSTSSFVAVAAGGVFIACWALLARSGRTRSRILAGVAILLIVGGIASLAVKTFAPNLIEAIETVERATLDKPNSESYDSRTRADGDSIATLAPTHGIGVGWGSNRSSSLGAGLLADLGLYGCALLPWVVLRIFRQLGRVRRTAQQTGRSAVLDAMAASLLATMMTGFLASPMINDVDFYLRLAVLVGCASRLERAGIGREQMSFDDGNAYRMTTR